MSRKLVWSQMHILFPQGHTRSLRRKISDNSRILLRLQANIRNIPEMSVVVPQAATGK